MSNPTIITCDCGQKNRLPLTIAAGKALQCGKCHAPLFDDEDLDDENEALDLEGGQS